MSVLSEISSGIGAAMKYLPAVQTAVQQVETDMTGAPGQDKKTAAVSAVLAVTHVGETVAVPQVQLVSGLIDVMVNVFNSLGIFKHSSTVVPQAPAPAPEPAVAPA